MATTAAAPARRRCPTEAQKAAAAERRAKFREIAQHIASMTDEQRATLAGQLSPRTIEGRALSMHNACLLAVQFPTVTIVGGFRQWKAAGRHVRKGEHGLSIWVPTKRTSAATVAVDTSVADLAGSVASDDEARPGFVMGTVFDVSQTEQAAE